MFQIQCKPVFFNIFATAEPLQMFCVVYGTLFNDQSVYLAFCNKHIFPWQFQCVAAEPLTPSSHSQNLRVLGNLS